MRRHQRGRKSLGLTIPPELGGECKAHYTRNGISLNCVQQKHISDGLWWLTRIVMNCVVTFIYYLSTYHYGRGRGWTPKYFHWKHWAPTTYPHVSSDNMKWKKRRYPHSLYITWYLKHTVKWIEGNVSVCIEKHWNIFLQDFYFLSSCWDSLTQYYNRGFVNISGIDIAALRNSPLDVIPKESFCLFHLVNPFFFFYTYYIFPFESLKLLPGEIKWGSYLVGRFFFFRFSLTGMLFCR